MLIFVKTPPVHQAKVKKIFTTFGVLLCEYCATLDFCRGPGMCSRYLVRAVLKVRKV